MLRVLISKAVLLSVMVGLLASCYGGKLVKMPVNTYTTSEQMDSLRVQQAQTLRLLAQLQAQLDEESETRLRSRAQSSVALLELEESVRILASRIDDIAQLMTGRSSGSRSDPRTTRPTPPPTNADTSADTASARSADAVDAERLYQTAYMDLTVGNYDLSIQGFKNYLERFPSGGHVSEVHYYVGECHYASDRHLEAIGSFQQVLREFPNSRLVPAAYLKSGLCYEWLDEKSLAQKTYRDLIERHPNTEEAQQAREALKAMEG